MKTLALLLLFASTIFAAAPDLNKPIPELKLNDGRTLKNVQLVGYASTAVMAKWEGGRGTLKYEDFPDDYQVALAAERPGGTPSGTAAPAAPSKPRASLDQVPEMDMTPLAPPPALIGPNQQISGQCFVATRGGTNYKLGLVEVRVYPKIAFDAYEKEILERSNPRFEHFRAHSKPALMAVVLHDMWKLLPPTPASAKTDADGKFSITHNVPAPFIVFARASRQAGGETEYYTWRVASDKIRNPAQLLLSNDNMD